MVERHPDDGRIVTEGSFEFLQSGTRDIGCIRLVGSALHVMIMTVHVILVNPNEYTSRPSSAWRVPRDSWVGTRFLPVVGGSFGSPAKPYHC